MGRAGSAHSLSALLSATYRTPAGPLTVIVDPHAAGDLGPTDYGAVVVGTFAGPEDAAERLPTDGRDIHPSQVVTHQADGQPQSQLAALGLVKQSGCQSAT